MKVTFNLYISNPEVFAKDPTSSSCYHLSCGRYMDKTWTFAGEVEFNIDVDRVEIVKAAKKYLDEQIGKATAVINILENRKAELLALPAPTGVK